MSSYKTYILQNKSVTKRNKAKSNNKKSWYSPKKTVSSENHQEVVNRDQICTVLGSSAMQCSVSLQLPAQAKTAFTVAVNHDRYAKKHTVGTKSVFTKEAERGHNYSHYMCISVVRFSSFLMCNDTWIRYVIKCTYHNTAATHKNCESALPNYCNNWVAQI